MSDLVIVCAKTDPNAPGAKGISLVLIEDGMKGLHCTEIASSQNCLKIYSLVNRTGFRKGKKLDKIGMKAQDTSELFFEDVRVPKTNILGQLNKGFPMLMQELPQERLLIADMAVAAAEACFEVTRDYVKER